MEISTLATQRGTAQGCPHYHDRYWQDGFDCEIANKVEFVIDHDQVAEVILCSLKEIGL